MTTDLENCIREALTTRGNAITDATLRRPATSFDHVSEGRATLDAPSTQHLVSVGAVKPRTKGRHAVTWLSVAAVVALIATAVALAVGGNNPSSRPGEAAAHADSFSLLRTLHFAVDLPAGYRLTKVLTSADGTQVVQISTTGNRNVEMSIDPPGGADRHFAADARPITVAGRPGFIASTWTDATVTSKTDSNSISWKYNDVAYAVFVNPDVDQGALLALARRVDFSQRTPVRVATSIRKLPAGTHLAVIDSTYDNVVPHPRYRWNSTIMFSLDSSARDFVRVDLCQCASSDSARRTAQTRTINGRTAYIYPNGAGGADVEIDEGNAVSLHVASSHDEGGQWTGTMTMLLELARSITVTRHPSQPGTWFDAATALP